MANIFQFESNDSKMFGNSWSLLIISYINKMKTAAWQLETLSNCIRHISVRSGGDSYGNKWKHVPTVPTTNYYGQRLKS